MFKIFKKTSHPDYIFLSCVILLTIFGLVILSSASSDLGKIKFNDTYFYLKHQIFFGLSLGVAGFLFAYYFHYKNLKKIAVPLLIINIIFLILVFTSLGTSHKGSSRWLNFGPISFQPAELLKISFIVYLSAWLSNRAAKRQSSFLGGFLPFLIISGFVAFLVFKQPATTTIAIILSAAFIIYFLSGVKMLYIAGVAFIGILAITSIIYLTPYRYQRIMTYLSEEKHQTTGYQLTQSLTAIGGGGLLGRGFGKSTIKYKYLPESIGDSIFAVIAEELGFIGSLFLLATFIVLFIRGFSIAKYSSNQFAKLTAIGLTSVIALQVFVHIAANSGIIPLTGVPLPFVSYGGTSLAVFLTMTGIIANISKNK